MKEQRPQAGPIDWISLSEAQRRLGISRPAVRKIARNGLVGTLFLPGVPTKLNAADVARVAKEFVKPARTP